MQRTDSRRCAERRIPCHDKAIQSAQSFARSLRYSTHDRHVVRLGWSFGGLPPAAGKPRDDEMMDPCGAPDRHACPECAEGPDFVSASRLRRPPDDRRFRSLRAIRPTVLHYYGEVGRYAFLAARWTMRTETSAGVTPLIRDACPRVSGWTAPSLFRDSVRICLIDA